MPADVNVTEKVARVIASGSAEPMWSAVVVARNALTALADPEVLAGMAGVLREVLAAEGGEPGSSLHSWRCEHPDVYGPCDCLAQVSDFQAAAVVEWLRGRA